MAKSYAGCGRLGYIKNAHDTLKIHEYCTVPVFTVPIMSLTHTQLNERVTQPLSRKSRGELKFYFQIPTYTHTALRGQILVSIGPIGVTTIPYRFYRTMPFLSFQAIWGALWLCKLREVIKEMAASCWFCWIHHFFCRKKGRLSDLRNIFLVNKRLLCILQYGHRDATIYDSIGHEVDQGPTVILICRKPSLLITPKDLHCKNERIKVFIGVKSGGWRRLVYSRITRR